MLFLDTHVVVWLFAGYRHLFSPTAKDLIEQSDLAISPIVKLELEYLYETGRTTVNGIEIVEKLERLIQLSVDSQSFYRVIDRSLGIKWTRDPFDRIITAHAELAGAKLLTKDPKIHSYFVNAAW